MTCLFLSCYINLKICLKTRISLLYLLFLIPSFPCFSEEIRAIVFDFGKVIATRDKKEIYRFIQDSFQMPPQEAKSLLQGVKKFEDEGGNAQDFWKAFAQKRQYTLPSDWQEQFERVDMQALKEIPGTLGLVRNLKEQGFTVALLSNVTPSHARVIAKLGYYHLFCPLLLSYEMGVKKPATRAYQILLEQLQLPPESILFIDDKMKNIQAARAAGINALLFINAETLIKDLEKRGIFVRDR